MLSIKHFFNKWFKKPKQKIKKSPNNSLCKIELLLNKNFTIDVFIEFDNLEINSMNDYQLFVEKISSFLNQINSHQLTYTIAELIIQDIGKEPQYTQFCNDIIKRWTILEKQKEHQQDANYHDGPIIKPSEAFSKYYNTHQK